MITIRRATPADAAQLQRISEGASAYGGTLQLPYSSVELWTERLRQSSGDDIVLVAVDGEVVVGSAGLHPEKKRRRLHVAMLGITVAESHAGRGIGSLLMAELMRLADQWMHLLRIELTVYTDNAAAIHLYRKFGFETEGCLRAYALRDGQYVDAYCMARLHPNPPRLPA
ncbi:GNAT family N-acetyltransferase [Undibacterium luofuense]|uniref:GNAT family N-acetyltransferase n=1 Tax=Undibacterium luofuense TaxID=2828733 RepID=UPI0030EDEA97